MSGTVLILGVGAAAGVGAAVARKFAGAGFHVMIAGRTREKLNATAADISAAGGSIESVVADVTSQEDQQRVFELVRARNEPLSAVIYNAGVIFRLSLVTCRQSSLKTFGASVVSARF